MRSVIIALFLSALAACATQRPVTPHQYLDEETSATVTVVADPWIFSGKRAERAMPTLMDDRAAAAANAAGERAEFAAERRDLISLYAIDVNRQGDHRQYMAVQQSLAHAASDSAAAAPSLELRFGGQTLVLQPNTLTPRELGIAKEPVRAHARGSQWSYFPIDKNVLTAIARSHDLQATLVLGGERVAYETWRDGSAELTELSAVLEK